MGDLRDPVSDLTVRGSSGWPQRAQLSRAEPALGVAKWRFVVVGWRRIPALVTALFALWIIDFYVSANPRWTWWAVGHLVGLALLAAVAAVVGIRFPIVGVGLLTVVSSSALFMGGSSPTGFGLMVLMLSVMAAAAFLALPTVFKARATWPTAAIGAVIGVALWAALFELAA